MLYLDSNCYTNKRTRLVSNNNYFFFAFLPSITKSFRVDFNRENRMAGEKQARNYEKN